MEDDFDGDYDGGDTGSYEPVEDTTSRSDVEEAVIQQKQGRGDPDPRRHSYGNQHGYLKGRADAGVGGNFEGLTRYHDEARRNGTTLQNAVRDYVQVEDAWRKNPVNGVIYTAQRLGLDPRQLVAAAYQQLYGQNGNQVAQQSAQRFEAERHQRDIEAFRADPAHKHFDAVRMDVARLVQSGRAKDLKSAYRMAVRNNAQLRVQEKIEKSYMCPLPWPRNTKWSISRMAQ
jgi:hypothetical protein